VKRIIPSLAILAAAAAVAGPSPVLAQAPLVDYEGSARGAQLTQSAEWRLAFRPTVQVVSQSVAQLRNLPGVAPAVVAEADQLVAQAAKQPEADARSSLWKAASLLMGRPWTPGQELVGALALRAGAPVSAGGKDHVTLEVLYPVGAPAKAHFSLALYRAEATTSATPKRGEIVRPLADGEVDGSGPRQVGIDLGATPDGAYLLIAKVSAPEGAPIELAQSIYVVRDLPARARAIRVGLGSIKDHEAAKAIAEYPFALAEDLAAGRREVISYDFPKAIARSEAILRDLKAGRDDVWQARGLQNRAYAFAPTGELIPYQLYVPTAWSPSKQWPVVVALHGANLDETNMLGRNGGEMQKLAEQHGFIVVAPLGYRLNSAYGSQRGMSNAIVGRDLERRRRSEEDVLQVLAKVEAEYSIDPKRRYLTGNSMGGGGTWWIGGQHPELWAALAPAAYGGVLPQDAPGLSHAPIMAVVGDHDELGMLARVKDSVATLEKAGVHPQYVEVAGGTHASAYEIALPRVFDFFSQHTN
jgi:poly(3-hydroxybutyrate) depolymerase